MSTSIHATERMKTLQKRKRAILVALLLWVAVLFTGAMDVWPPPAQMLFLALSPGLLIYFLVLRIQIRREAKHLPATVEVPAPVKLSLRNSIVAVTILYIFDALFLGQGVISIFVSVVALLWLLPAAALAARKNKAVSLLKLKRAGLVALMLVAVLGTTRFNQNMAERRADLLVSAVKQYRSKYGQFPRRLDEVAPEFIPSIPSAKFTLTYSEFTYSNLSNDNPFLYYVVFPPFGRRIYYFRTDRWGTLD